MGPVQREALYRTLETTYLKERTGTDIIFIMGDFNSKIGRKQEEDEDFMGAHGKGRRNENGEALRAFLLLLGLYLANTHFRHRPMQTATWRGGLPARNSRLGVVRSKQPGLHNQIYYIIVPKRLVPMITDA
jgi:hypothetical protein